MRWKAAIRRRAAIVIVSLCGLILAVGATAGAEEYRYGLSAGGGLATITGGEGADFALRPVWQGAFDYNLGDRWTLGLAVGWYYLYDDSTASSPFTFGSDKADAERRFEATRLGLTLTRELFEPASWMTVHGGFGGGLLIWEMKDPNADTVLKTIGPRNETLDFQATEIFVSAALGFKFGLVGRWSLDWTTHADYLTGAGADFADNVNSDRDRVLVGSMLTLGVAFGGGATESGWRSDRAWSGSPAQQRKPVRGMDSDGDGVPDSKDNCADTPAGVLVDGHGCATDSDLDGVVDGRDHCPDTDPAARGRIDINGCPIDGDFDGVPDFLDACADNAVGAFVDDSGCPIDSDGDGVPDGLDDCPNTLYGVDVDRYGCIDLSMFSAPMVLNIDYPSGSFEVDPRSRERLKQLSRLLMVVPEMQLEVNGYTDNIGMSTANQALSEKRANRVRDFLISQGIDTARIKVFGRGEVNFIASNETAGGRAKNRRIEIIFYK